jgi:hypothetical protein
MARLVRTIGHLWQCTGMLCFLLLDATRFLWLCLRPEAALAAENPFLRQQLALYQEHHVKPRRATNATRLTMVWLSQWFDWHPVLVVVQPETFKRWRRQRGQLFWRGLSCPGRPPIPVELQALIRQMACDNLTWGQRRIANELRLKLGIQVSPRTVRKYMPTYRDRVPGQRVPSQRWRTFVHNHAHTLIVSGMAVDLLRSVQALCARLISTLKQWWDRAVASGWSGTAQCDALAIVLLRNPLAIRAAWPPDTGDWLSVVERSPPDRGSSHNHAPCPATRATQVDTVVVCPVVAALDGWNRGLAPAHGAPRPRVIERRGLPRCSAWHDDTRCRYDWQE